jgi:hypothetical protein
VPFIGGRRAFDDFGFDEQVGGVAVRAASVPGGVVRIIGVYRVPWVATAAADQSVILGDGWADRRPDRFDLYLRVRAS